MGIEDFRETMKRSGSNGTATAQSKRYIWFLWPPYEVQRTGFDAFVAVQEGFRIRLMGHMLELSFEASGTCSPDAARALADKYIEILARHARSDLSLLTDEEFI